ncbi:MAG: murein L,D-transpeptidase catalytic domain family protein [Chitinophagaceae bacterium]|nr:murein L,D-transpeptidase catalytic domain family protein [Chitinophagaceae bacterium]MBK8951919.1 murein L,D-transpeptidase catalytic domain family protein [Chitinophagaceae bacterium]
MKKLFIPVSLGMLCASFTIVPPVPVKSKAIIAPVTGKKAAIPPFISDAVCDVYITAGLEEKGLSELAFKQAWKGYQFLVQQKSIHRTGYLTVCDYSKSSREKRLYIIDIGRKRLISHTYVAHGRNSGNEYASSFSNKPESLQSSLGFYITSTTYDGENGLSLRLSGVDRGFNDNAFARSIVLHGAAYVDAVRVAKGTIMGRSFGCPAVSKKEAARIIHTIKNGSCLFIYYPDKYYSKTSTILNG